MTAPGVSVIIVNWNTRDMVLELLEELSMAPVNSGHELELIVVDNDSSDGSVEAIRRDFPAVEIVPQKENRGFAGGVNPGIKVASQPLVLLLNSDAKTSRASIEESAQYLADHPEVGILGPRIRNPDGSPQSSAWRDPSLLWMALAAVGLNKLKPLNFERYCEEVCNKPVEINCVCGCAMLIRRDLLLELGGLDEDYFMYFEETDLCVRARRLGSQVHHGPIGEFVHEDAGTSKAVRLRSHLDFQRSQVLFYLKHHGVPAAIAARGLLVLKAALRLPPLAALSLRSDKARMQLKIHWKTLAWLLDPSGGLVPDVDRSD